MNDSRSIRLHYLFRAAVLAAFALYILHLMQQDALHYYVAPALAKWIRLCPVPLGLMALSLVVQALLGRSQVLCNCNHRLPAGFLKSTGLYGLFVLPLLLGFLLPDKALGSIAAAKKGISLSYSAMEPEKATSSRVPEPKNSITSAATEPDKTVTFETSDPYAKEFAELAKLLYAQPVIPVYPAIYSETFGAIEMFKEQFAGKEIAVSGFVYRDQTDGTSGPFAVSRFLVQCCTADATPFGIMVDPQQKLTLPADSWVKVQGKLKMVSQGGKDLIEIEATQITPISQPQTPYIYTSADSVAAWKELQKDAANGK
ncbi:TIGR03943 family protein [Paenibacillus sp. XY044]|uniref:TIGR03943 family putative permease subunit n=1 Tax=Paenibacillus sp. XY044 TaxID=2026089 RepID=UPI000B98227E|nr:TIGR03943 family protein [Paenibacillus sp. XY044]OZB94422.1 TIGR03943 family protein [Paenibacillus sp. XY044]